MINISYQKTQKNIFSCETIKYQGLPVKIDYSIQSIKFAKFANIIRIKSNEKHIVLKII